VNDPGPIGWRSCCARNGAPADVKVSDVRSPSPAATASLHLTASPPPLVGRDPAPTCCGLTRPPGQSLTQHRPVSTSGSSWPSSPPRGPCRWPAALAYDDRPRPLEKPRQSSSTFVDGPQLGTHAGPPSRTRNAARLAGQLAETAGPPSTAAGADAAPDSYPRPADSWDEYVDGPHRHLAPRRGQPRRVQPVPPATWPAGWRPTSRPRRRSPWSTASFQTGNVMIDAEGRNAGDRLGVRPRRRSAPSTSAGARTWPPSPPPDLIGLDPVGFCSRLLASLTGGASPEIVTPTDGRPYFRHPCSGPSPFGAMLAGVAANGSGRETICLTSAYLVFGRAVHPPALPWAARPGQPGGGPWPPWPLRWSQARWRTDDSPLRPTNGSAARTSSRKELAEKVAPAVNRPHRWATSLHNGRPHPPDAWRVRAEHELRLDGARRCPAIELVASRVAASDLPGAAFGSPRRWRTSGPTSAQGSNAADVAADYNRATPRCCPGQVEATLRRCPAPKDDGELRGRGQRPARPAAGPTRTAVIGEDFQLVGRS